MFFAIVRSLNLLRARSLFMKKWKIALYSMLCLIAFPSSGFAQGTGKIDAGDTAFVLLCASLVMLMTPGLAMFYGGMVRRKNVLGTLMQSFVAIALVSVQWVLFGYSLSFIDGSAKNPVSKAPIMPPTP